MKNTFLALLAAASLALFAPAPRAEPQSPPDEFRPRAARRRRPRRAGKIPARLGSRDHLLRFRRRPKNGGPADAHEKFATLSPEPAGEWRWLGPRALQFRPAEPWTPLARVVVKSGSSETRLVALLPTPSSTTPADGADPDARTDANRADFPFAGRSEGAGAPARHRDAALAGHFASAAGGCCHRPISTFCRSSEASAPPSKAMS